MKVEKLNETTARISFRYNPQLVSFVKTLTGRQYVVNGKYWTIPLIGSIETLKKLKEEGFEVLSEVWEEAKRQDAEGETLEAIACKPTQDFPTSLPLFPYQKTGARFLTVAGSGLLGDEVGLGKTVMTLAVIEQLKPEKVLVLCPAILKEQWGQEIKKFVPDLLFQIIDGDMATRAEQWVKNATVYVANYELLLRDFARMDRQWDMIVADEATRISNPFSKQARALKKLKAKRRYALTGTPVSNRANEIWNIIDWTNPGVLGSYHRFVDEYCVRNMYGGVIAYRNLTELKKRLKRFMIRRLKSEVVPELPEKIVSDVPFKLGEDEKKLYDQLRKELLLEIEKELLSKVGNPATIQNTIVKMLRLRQLVDSMELLGVKKVSTKTEVLKEMLADVLDDGRKAIVFTQFAEMARLLARDLTEWRPLVITGDVPEHARQERIEQFNVNESNKILVMTSAGQWGLNIQRASVIFHFDQEWSLAKLSQREGRAHRIGQKQSVLCYHLLAKGTIDYYVRKVLHKKQELAGALLGDAPLGLGDLKEMLIYEDV